jgi:hypothetical protein
MTLRSQDYAELAEHSYDRKGDLAHLVNQTVTLGGVEYRILAHADRPSGYQGTIYQRMDTGEITVAHRGTEFEREKFKDLIVTDGGMVAARTNLQADDAVELTRQATKMARENLLGYKPAPEVTVTGHSLGGTLAQISAHHFGLKGETFNAYGAASLDRRIREGGNDVLNHVMAADLVSSGSPHYGQVRVYTNSREIETLQRYGYENDRSPLDLRRPASAAFQAMDGGSHDMHNFLPIDGQQRADRSVLDDPQARRLAQQYDPMIDKFRADVGALRDGVSRSLRGPAGTLDDAVDWLRGPLEPGEPARRETQGERRTSNDMREPSHPANGKYQQAYTGVVEIDRSLGRTPDGASERLAASLTAAGAGLSSIGQVGLSGDGSRAFAVEGRQGPVEARGRVHVDVAAAVQRPVETSTQDWQAATQQLAQQQQEERLAREQTQPVARGPAMA